MAANKTKRDWSRKKKDNESGWLTLPLHTPVAIHDKNGKPVPFSEVENKLRDMLNLVRDEANSLITTHATSVAQRLRANKVTGVFGLAQAREIFGGLALPADLSNSYRVSEMIRGLAWDSLRSWVTRNMAAELWLGAGNGLAYPDFLALHRSTYGKGLDPRLYTNISRSGGLQAVPVLGNGKLKLSAANEQYSRVSLVGNMIELELTVWERKLTLFFVVPEYLRGRVVRVSRPVIEEVNGRLTFAFSFVESRMAPGRGTNRVLGVDLGVKVPFTAVVRSSRGVVSDPLLPSKRVLALWGKLGRVRSEKQTVGRKLSRLRHAVAGSPLVGLAGRCERLRVERERLRGAEVRLMRDLPYLVAQDVCAHAVERGVTHVVIERLSWTTHGWEHKAFTAALEHVAPRYGLVVSMVNPRGTSQECPSCSSVATHPSWSVTKCSSCGWSGDRDYAAAIVIAGRAKQVKSLPRKSVRVKAGPTPKRPSRVVKSSLRTRCPEQKRCRADLPLPVSHHGRKNWITPGVKENQRTLYSSNPILTGVLSYNESKIT